MKRGDEHRGGDEGENEKGMREEMRGKSNGNMRARNDMPRYF